MTFSLSQERKFYLASFFKNQTYFVPILVIFFQDLGLSFADIFWVMTLGAGFSFLIEIPTGVFADVYGKRKSIIFSRFIIALAFVAFGLSTGFWTLLAANLLYELGKSFRSGTETAYIYDYLAETEGAPTYTKIKAGQKFYARLSESISAAIGGFVAVQFGFSMVFYLATIPAVMNALQTLSWDRLKTDGKEGKFSLKGTGGFLQEALQTVRKKRALQIVMMNVMLFSTAFVALQTFVQPYMLDAGLTLEVFGIVYSVFLFIAAFTTRYSSNLEERFGGVRMMNVLTFLAIIPLVILGLGYVSVIGIGLFFLVLMIENIRSTIANTVFHDQVESANRATMGSLLELGKTGSQMVFLPMVGYLADGYSFYTAILLLAGVVALVAVMFFIRGVGEPVVKV